MNEIAPHGTTIQGAVDQACTLNPDPCSTAAPRLAAASLRACAADHRLEPGQADAAQPFYKPVPAWVGFSFQASALAPAARGYATASSGFGEALESIMDAARARRRGPAPAAPRASDELAFLNDKNLSIEDKLMRFMALMLQKADRELVDKMKEYEAKKRAHDAKENGAKSAEGGGGGGLLGGIGDALGGILGGGGGGLFGGIGDALGGMGGMLTGGGAQSLIKDLGGPVLGAVCTAVGLPFLAPIAMKLGGELGSLAANTTGAASRASGQAEGTTGASGGDRASAASGSSSEEGFDERLEMMKLQRLVEKVNAMFQALSNVMKSMHDAQMTAVGNIR